MINHLIRTTVIGFILVAKLLTGLPARADESAGKLNLARQPAPGVLLVARRALRDPNFSRRVVLLVRHNRKGTLGLVINRRSRSTLGDVIPSLGRLMKKPVPVYFGGPVHFNRATFLWRGKKGKASLLKVMPGIYFGGDRRDLKNLIRQQPGDTRLRVYVGHAGWAPGQLATELRRGDWHMLRGTPIPVFSRDTGSLWRRLINQVPAGDMIVQQRHGSG